VFLLVPAYPGSPGTKAIKRLLLLFLYVCHWHKQVKLIGSDWQFQNHSIKSVFDITYIFYVMDL